MNTLTNFSVYVSPATTERMQMLVASEAFNLSLIGFIHFNERSHTEGFHSISPRIHSDSDSQRSEYRLEMFLSFNPILFKIKLCKSDFAQMLH